MYARDSMPVFRHRHLVAGGRFLRKYHVPLRPSPVLYIPIINNMAPTVTATVSVLNMPLLDKGVAMFVNGVQNVDIPAGTSQMYNHAQNYLDR